MTELNRQHRESVIPLLGIRPSRNLSRSKAPGLYANSGGTGPITDVSVLHGDFWPEEESIEEFLKALHEWRDHARTNPGA